MSIYKSGYKNGSDLELRLPTLAECLTPYKHTWHVIDLHGNWRNVKITSVKTWKRQPGKVEIHWKYGLYEYGYSIFENSDFSSGPALMLLSDNCTNNIKE